jgi:hypothetical protein
MSVLGDLVIVTFDGLPVVVRLRVRVVYGV